METETDFDYVIYGSLAIIEAKSPEAIEFLKTDLDFQEWQQIVKNQVIIDSNFLQGIIEIIQDSGLTIMEER